MFARVLVWLVLLVGGWWLLRKKAGTSPAGAPRRGRRSAGAEAMVDCAHCGVHVPASEAVRGAGAAYCCAAHRAARTARGAS